ncbi:DNA uptake porin HofQ [Enterobacteriaceae bacterium EKM102V]|uniref:DNA uptake porin HofQ n=1 Tax=Pantoea TaxID=53335 RepID=UPI00142D54DB|nr:MULTISPECIES: DNA uptake porin HofQ [Pantoea]KAF6658304.1 DNA uptake porin HofQ [Enterobacteriaceae bacterium EKM102V]KAF6666908.1 DNA uptake porin HofQ [Pantoea sp. EKM103V]
MLRIATLLLISSLQPVYAADEAPLSLAFDHAPVEQILQALADYQQVNLLIAPEVEGTLSLRLDNLPWRQSLALVARMAKLTVIEQDNVLLVYPLRWQQAQDAAREAERQAQLQQTPLQQRTVTLRYASASDVHASLLSERQSLMTPRGSVTVDKRTNALLLRDTAAALKETVRWIQGLDRPLEQIELSAHIVTISEEHLQELGVQWGMLAGDAAVTESLHHPRLAVPLAVSSPGISAGMALARIGGALLDLELSALEQENQIEIIASPRLFTSHQQTASIKQGTEIPYEVSAGNSGATSIEFKEAVLGMEVTPTIAGNGRIRLKIHISQNMPGRSIRTGDSDILSIDKQEIETQVTVSDGQTLALGGIFQQQRNRGENRVPLLGKVPLIGGLFRQQSAQRKKRELVIFITPRLVREAALTTG